MSTGHLSVRHIYSLLFQIILLLWKKIMQIILVQEEKFIIMHLVKINSQCLMTDKQSKELVFPVFFLKGRFGYTGDRDNKLSLK